MVFKTTQLKFDMQKELKRQSIKFLQLLKQLNQKESYHKKKLTIIFSLTSSKKKKKKEAEPEDMNKTGIS